jgi:hypothetical protein
MEEQNYEEIGVLKYEEIPEFRRKLENIGVTTESQNRLPLFEPTLRATYGVRVFEGKYGKLTIKGRLGQAHKNLLETILWKKEVYEFIEIEGREHLKVLYDEEKIRKYLSQKSKYSYEGYKTLLEDMIQTYIELETEKLRIQGTLIIQRVESIVLKPTKTRSPLIPKQVPLTVVIFGAVASELIKNELKFTYDPKLIMALKNGISQALVRYLKTHKNHPSSGYHLKELIKNLVENIEGQKWYDIKRLLKKDAEQLEQLGIVINFKEDRLFVIEKL